MTPREFREAVEGHDLWVEHLDARLAWAVGHIMAPHVKRSRSLVKKLWNALRRKKEKMTPQEVMQALDPKLKAQAVIDKIRQQRKDASGG